MRWGRRFSVRRHTGMWFITFKRYYFYDLPLLLPVDTTRADAPDRGTLQELGQFELLLCRVRYDMTWISSSFF